MDYQEITKTLESYTHSLSPPRLPAEKTASLPHNLSNSR